MLRNVIDLTARSSWEYRKINDGHLLYIAAINSTKF